MRIVQRKKNDKRKSEAKKKEKTKVKADRPNLSNICFKELVGVCVCKVYIDIDKHNRHWRYQITKG